MASSTSEELAARVRPGRCAALLASLSRDRAEELAAGLGSALDVWASRAAGRPVKAVRLSLVGDEIEPYVPSVAWAGGYGDYTWSDGVFRGREAVFREAPAFEPTLLGELCHAAEEAPTLADEADFEVLKACFVARTWEDLQRAAQRLEPRLAASPYEVLVVTLGHDGDTRLLFQRR